MVYKILNVHNYLESEVTGAGLFWFVCFLQEKVDENIGSNVFQGGEKTLLCIHCICLNGRF